MAETRRSRVALERALAQAATDAERARAHLALAVFHDNNSREVEAVPQYESALEAGIDGEDRARCLAWLASSLFKTARPAEALSRLEESRQATQDPYLCAFLDGLERRILRSVR